LLEIVRLRIANEVPCLRRHAFGLFLDFSSAYNTVLHRKLYMKLLKALSLAEVQLVKAIYSRCRVKLGAHSFNPNVGVAQGSVISPALFNIYCEDLYEDIRDIAIVNVEDILGYADDLLVICTSVVQIKNVLRVIDQWCQENNLHLNPKKSGIVEFVPRQGNSTNYLQIGSNVDGIPVVEKYKYLGVWIDGKLTMDPQLQHIKDKANFLVYKL